MIMLWCVCSSIHNSCQYNFAFTLNGKQIEHPCYVIPDLNEPLILGIDFIQHHQLWYCPKSKSFAWESQPNWGQGHLKICTATVVPPLSVAYINFWLIAYSWFKSSSDSSRAALALLMGSGFPLNWLEKPLRQSSAECRPFPLPPGASDLRRHEAA